MFPDRAGYQAQLHELEITLEVNGQVMIVTSSDSVSGSSRSAPTITA